MAFAYSPETREVKAVRLNATEGHPIKVTPKMVPRTCVVGLHLEGPKITRVAVFDIEPGKWSPLDLDEPASGVVQPMALGHGAVGVPGRSIFLYVLIKDIHVGSSGAPGHHSGTADPGDAH